VTSSGHADKDLTAVAGRRGRGGAGNYVWKDEEDEEAKQQKEEIEIELKDMVTKDVEAGLSRPDRAFLRQENE
jgi:hypothetical protein